MKKFLSIILAIVVLSNISIASGAYAAGFRASKDNNMGICPAKPKEALLPKNDSISELFMNYLNISKANKKLAADYETLKRDYDILKMNVEELGEAKIKVADILRNTNDIMKDIFKDMNERLMCVRDIFKDLFSTLKWIWIMFGMEFVTFSAGFFYLNRKYKKMANKVDHFLREFFRLLEDDQRLFNHLAEVVDAHDLILRPINGNRDVVNRDRIRIER